MAWSSTAFGRATYGSGSSRGLQDLTGQNILDANVLASLVVDRGQIPPDKNIVPTGMVIAPTKNARRSKKDIGKDRGPPGPVRRRTRRTRSTTRHQPIGDVTRKPPRHWLRVRR